MAEYNSAPLKAAIVNLLQKENLSLAELRDETGSSLPTLRRAMKDLADSAWISTEGVNGATGGRPARLYGLNGASHLIIGVHIEIPMVHMVAVDLNGAIVEQAQHSADDALSPDESVRAITAFVGSIRSAHPNRRVLGIGMAAPGYVDAATGVILYVGRAPGWENYPMRARLEAELDLPVMMENDTDCLIRFELINMNGRDLADTIYLGVLEGVKVSMLLNGRIYSGPFGNAGLVGRTRICAETADGQNHRARELEEVASVGGLCRDFDSRVKALAQISAETAQIHAMTDHKRKFYAILDAAEAGDSTAFAVVQQMVEHLAEAICNLIFVLQPLVLIVGGVLSQPPAGVSAMLEQGIRARLPNLLSNHLVIHYASHTGRYAAATGAARMFLQRLTTTESASF